jgi:UPF0042 nucleotide-binding protein
LRDRAMSLQDLVVVTGMSGSGKGTMLKAFEDLGYFCIDNLPVPLIPRFIEGIHVSGGVVERAALGIDIRAGDRLSDLEKILRDLREYEFRVRVLYLEARDEVLVRRFSETRRPHPLAGKKGLRESIELERKRLRKIRNLADMIVDTSEYTIHHAKSLVAERFRECRESGSLTVYFISFGYKYGIPLEADLLFDARFLPNPFFVPGLRALSGRSRKVAIHMRSLPQSKEFVRRLLGFLKYLIPYYIREGKSYLTVGIGCTGGRHRSVFLVEELGRLLKMKRAKVQLRHRDESR